MSIPEPSMIKISWRSLNSVSLQQEYQKEFWELTQNIKANLSLGRVNDLMSVT
jgi:hypothetical protein